MASPRSIVDLIGMNGGDFPHEVSALLQDNGWIPQLAPHYVDISTGKTREIDVIGRKKVETKDSFWGSRGEFLIRLFIECKTLESDYLLHFATRNHDKAMDFVKDNLILRQDGEMNLERSHYLTDSEVVKTWDPAGRDDFYDAWTQSVHSMIFFSENQHEGPYVIDVPIVVFRSFDHLYRRDGSKQGYSLVTEPFQVEVDYTYPVRGRNTAKTFFVDFVAFDNLKTFLDTSIGQDISLLSETLASQLGRDAFERMQDQQRYRDDSDPFSSY